MGLTYCIIKAVYDTAKGKGGHHSHEHH
jgi:hypothetical protein